MTVIVKQCKHAVPHCICDPKQDTEAPYSSVSSFVKMENSDTVPVHSCQGD